MHFQLVTRCVKFRAFRAEPRSDLNDTQSMHLRSELRDAPGWRVMMAVLAIVLLRSGNQPPVKVSGSEMQARNTLERVFVVRPRTKELLTHPVLVLTAMLLLMGRRRGVWLGFVGGVIGQASALNTFCHLHTPLTFSLIRDFNGLWLGAVLGVLLCVVWLAGERVWQKRIARAT